MNFKELLLHQVRFILIFVIALAFFSGCKKEVMCSETTWYQDTDGDGLGNPTASILDCNQPIGYVSNNTDDDDTQIFQSDQRINAEINSNSIGETYPLRIFLPGGYETKNLPVVYVLDGKYNFEVTINYCSQIGLDAIIVGIGAHAFNEDFARRNRDFLPGFSYNGVEGGHINFYNFLTQEVVTYIDEKYENNHDTRSLVGFSAGGIFTLFAFLNEAPEDAMFNGFLAIDPVNNNSAIITEMAQNLEFSPEAKTIKLHISQSSEFSIEWFNDVLETEAFPWLDLQYDRFEDKDHLAVIEPAMIAGLKFIYDIE